MSQIEQYEYLLAALREKFHEISTRTATINVRSILASNIDERKGQFGYIYNYTQCFM